MGKLKSLLLYCHKAQELKFALYEPEARFCYPHPHFFELSVKRPTVFIFMLVIVHVRAIRTWKQ